MKRGIILAFFIFDCIASTGCVSAGRYTCDGVAITAPIIPVGVHAAYCRDGSR